MRNRLALIAVISVTRGDSKPFVTRSLMASSLQPKSKRSKSNLTMSWLNLRGSLESVNLRSLTTKTILPFKMVSQMRDLILLAKRVATLTS